MRWNTNQEKWGTQLGTYYSNFARREWRSMDQKTVRGRRKDVYERYCWENNFPEIRGGQGRQERREVREDPKDFTLEERSVERPSRLSTCHLCVCAGNVCMCLCVCPCVCVSDFLNLFMCLVIYVSLAALVLCCCMQTSSSLSEWGLLSFPVTLPTRLALED